MLREILKNTVGFLAGLVTFGQMFSGVFYCKAIYKKGSTKNIPSTPFIAGLVLSTLFLQQGRLLQDSNMYFINLLGIILNAGYIMFYYLWSTKDVRLGLLRHLTKAFIGVMLLLLYANFENPAKVESRYGFIVTIILLSFIAAPLLSLPKIIEKKSTEGLPYPMIISGFAVSLLWLLYSVIIWNKVLFIQNGIAALLCGIQLSLFAIYPDKSLKSVAKSKGTKILNSLRIKEHKA